MSSTFSIALSALKAQSEAIDITGNNLANLNTTGFKESEVNFEDMISQSMGGTQIGMGVAPPAAEQDFTQGARVRGWIGVMQNAGEILGGTQRARGVCAGCCWSRLIALPPLRCSACW